MLLTLEQMSAEQYVPPSTFAWVHLALGEVEAAFEWLNKAADVFDQLLLPIKTYRSLDPIRSDSRFSALFQKMRLEP